MVHHTQDHQTIRTTLIIALDHNHLIIIEMEMVHDNQSRVIDCVTSKIFNSLLDQEQTDSTVSNTENTDTQIASEETRFEQQFNELLLALNQDKQDEYFNCQEEYNTITEE